MTGTQSIEAFERARTWRAYIEAFGVVGGCNHVVARAQALPEEERAYALEMLVRNLLLAPLVFRDTPYWAPWAQGDEELTDAMRGPDDDLLPEDRYGGLHDSMRMREHYVMRRMLEEFSRSCSNADWVDVWLGRAVDFFLYEDSSGHRYACTTCAQVALDLMSTDAARTEAIDRNIAGARQRHLNHQCISLLCWLRTRKPYATERDADLRWFCTEHPSLFNQFLLHPTHQSTLRRLFALGLAAPHVLETAV